MPASERTLLVYGANGYTGQLLLERLPALSARVVAAGRSRWAVQAAAARAGVEHRVFGLDDPRALDAALAGATLVLNAAGPFRRTAEPLIDACLRSRVDYLDLCGELEPLGYAARCDGLAKKLGVMLLPAVGFDVVPSDCLALHLAEKLPGAQRLTLGISASNLLSRGSAATLIEHAGIPVHVRRDGRLEELRFRSQLRFTDFGAGERPTLAVSWGDLVTAFHSTGIPNIEVYFEATAFRMFAVTANQTFGPALKNPLLTRFLETLARVIPEGPSQAERASERSVVVGEVTRGRESVRARLVAPEAYTCSVDAAARCIERVLAGRRRPGFRTPGALFGSDFVLELAGVSRESVRA
jgi:short subunit dehydrogenase-like uncharacterized protein